MIKIRKTKWIADDDYNRNTILLQWNNWDDYGYKTTYNFAYCDEDGKIAFSSTTQIYCKALDCEEKERGGSVDSYVSMEINQLDENFCSLGQDLNYYKELKRLLPNDYKDVLRRLNDLAYDNRKWEEFKKYTGVQQSLLRSSSSSKARQEAYELLEEDRILNDNLTFLYKAKVPYSTNVIPLKFIFDKNENIPYRINAIVGKNGTGKTQILSELAKDLSGFTDNGEKVNLEVFDGGLRPAFDKVMSISYSAFDSFKKLRGIDSLDSYVYCGIQSEHGTLSLNELQNNFRDALSSIRKKERSHIWQRIIEELFSEENYNMLSYTEENQFENINWSSGQHILISSMTEVISKIERESVVLFDEPEIHLHPNAIANVMRMINMLLNEFDSYAIIATHSPIILQEIPSNNVVVLERIDNQPFVRKPVIECFGENISQITRDIFDVSSRESVYQSVFTKMKDQGKNKEDIEKMFNNNLGLNASIFLESLFRGEI